jgi:poly-gamma-glutamate synthesis protein (capsule biosynthesis protein)
VLSLGSGSSGVPAAWAATRARPGVDFLPDLSDASAAAVVERAARARRPGDRVVASIHWGDNWGYEVLDEQVRFAHRLIDGGVDVVHGHSSHHPRPVERYRDKLVLYGCGDLVDDYEGISGYERYRGDLSLVYLATLDAATGALDELRMLPFQMHRFRLRRAAPRDARWLAGTLDEVSAPFGARVDLVDGGALRLRSG